MDSEKKSPIRGGELAIRLDEVGVPVLSPENQRIAYESSLQGNRDVWIADLIRGTSTRLTSDAAIDGAPLFSPDGSQIAFASMRRGTFDIVVAATQFAERMGQFSPDGHFVVYESNESGRPEIMAQAFPLPQVRWRVSIYGGTALRWSADGREIFFVAPDGRMMAVPVAQNGATLEVEKPVRLFATHIVNQRVRHEYTVASDGRFFVNSISPTDDGTSPISLILNWRR